MPTVARYFGIVITMNYREHPPPHFHVRYGEYRALVAIGSLQLLRGELPPRVLGLVIEWAMQREAQLRENWARARDHRPLKPIAPLE